jgi:CDP-diacylglycerol pyrophosphatase
MSLIRRLAPPGLTALALAILFAAPASCADRDALRRIVEDQCLVHWREQHTSAPCEEVDVEDGAHPEAGYAILADRKGGAHFLLIPTGTITGIESPALLAPDALNYFDAAWQARERLARVVGHEVPRDEIGLAVNPPHARSQDQLHIHIECLRADVLAALNRAKLTDSWSPIDLGGASYAARTLAGNDLMRANPFKLLASDVPQPGKTLGDYTLVVAGRGSKSEPGFVVLASPTAAGELLLDSTCAAASGGR